MIEIEIIPDSIQYIPMDDDRYFSKEFSNCISNSKLTLINPDQGGSKEKYLKGLGKSCSDSLVFGSAVHELVLQPDDFYLEDNVDRPTSKLGYVAEYLYKICKREKCIPEDLKDSHIEEACLHVNDYANSLNEQRLHKVKEDCMPYLRGRYDLEGSKITPIFLSKKGRDKCLKCVDKIHDNPQISGLLNPEGCISLNEGALFIDFKATDTETGKSIILRVKGKLDNFTIDEGSEELVLNDLKTTGHLLKEFAGSFNKFHYSRQMAIYILMLIAYAKKYHNIHKPKKVTANMLVVSTVPDYYSGVYKVSREQIEEGFREFIKLLKLAAEVEFEKI